MTEQEKKKEQETKCEKKRAPQEPECPDYEPETPTPSPSIPSALIPNLHFFMVDDRGKAVAEFTLKNIANEGRGPSMILALSNPDNVVPELQRMNRDQLTSFANSIEEIAVRAREFMARFNGHTEEKPAVTPPAPPKPVAAEKPAKPRRGSRKPRADAQGNPSTAPAPAPAPAKPTAPAIIPTVPSQPAKPPTTPPPQAPAKDDLDDLEREIMVYLDGSSGMSFGDISQKTNQKGKALFTAIQSLMTKKLLVKGEDMLFRRVDH